MGPSTTTSSLVAESVTTCPGCGHQTLSAGVSLVKVQILGNPVGLLGLSYRPAPGWEGQDPVIGSPAISTRDGAGVDPQRKACCDQSREVREAGGESEAFHWR